MLGGRSGSVDVVAYLGFRVAEWDAFDQEDPESLRLARMAPDLCSTIHLSRTDSLEFNADYWVRTPSGKEQRTSFSARAALHAFLEGSDVRVIHKSGVEDFVDFQ